MIQLVCYNDTQYMRQWLILNKHYSLIQVQPVLNCSVYVVFIGRSTGSVSGGTINPSGSIIVETWLFLSAWNESIIWSMSFMDYCNILCTCICLWWSEWKCVWGVGNQCISNHGIETNKLYVFFVFVLEIQFVCLQKSWVCSCWNDPIINWSHGQFTHLQLSYANNS